MKIEANENSNIEINRYVPATPDEAEMGMRTVKRQALLGMLWKGGYQVFYQIASLLAKLLLIRFLVPADFGLLAMAMTIFTSLDILNRFAGGEPFIRDNDSDPRKAQDTLFCLNCIFLGGTLLLGLLSAPAVSQFFSGKIPDRQSLSTLTWMIRIYSLKLLFSLVASVPLAILTKKLKFKELYVGNLAGASAFFLFAPALAYLGLGVWSIVSAHIAEQIIITLFYWKCAPFVPSFTFDNRIARNYLSYNGNLFLSSLMAVVITNGDDAVIGRMMGPVQLGFYTIGQQLAQFVMLIPNNTSEILFPVFSGIQENPSRLKRVYLKAFRVTHVFTLPFIGGSIVLAREAVLTLFGEKWLPILPVFYVLCLAVLLQSLISMANPLFCSLNKPHLLKYSQILNLLAFLIVVYPSAKLWGYLGVCWVMVLLALIPFIFLGWKLTQEIEGIFGDLVKVLSKVFSCTLAMMVGLVFLKEVIPRFWGPGRLALLAVGGAAVYFGLLSIVDEVFREDMRDGLNLVRKKEMTL